MVRGPNGQLWPAWVFCTRYSDRPSSGKISDSIVFIFVLMVLKEKLNPTKISQTKRYFQSHNNFEITCYNYTTAVISFSFQK
jgi:hypothetical protein